MIRLSCGDDTLVVAPEHGGTIVDWTRRGRYLLRHPSPEAVSSGDPGGMGCFPLVPFCNRIAFRRFQWSGQPHELAANFGDHPHAIHGVGWQNPWSVAELSTDSVTLSLRHDAVGETARAWPFAFTSRLTYRLSASGLTITIEATNRHGSPAPMGIGAHPWFPRGPGARLVFQADSVWINRNAIPSALVAIPAAWDHAEGRAVDDEPLDNCFTGWRREALLPALRVTADPILSNLQVYTPAGADFFCVEPVSHIPDAINRPDLPANQAMTVLDDGETLRGSMTFTPDDA